MFTRHEQKNFYNIGVNYEKADAEVRGRFSISNENRIALLQEAKEHNIGGVFVLSTCNRTEVSGFATCPFRLIQLLCKYSNGSIEEFNKVSNIYQGQEAINHIFRIGTGLDSQILGDYEIVGQLRQSFKLAKEQGTTNAYTERLLNSVMQASKRVKNETMLSSGTTSVSYAGVRYIIDNVEDFNSKNIVVFGLGKMGKHTCLNLAKYTQNKLVTLVNRTEDKVAEFVKEHPSIKKGNYRQLTSEISTSDVLIVSTASETHTITKEHLPKDKNILILDLSMPANVSPKVNNMPNVTLVNVDELSKITDETLALRQKEIPKAEAIIAEYRDDFFEWLHHRKFVPAIFAFKKSLQSIQQDEISYQRKKLNNFDEEQAEAITSRIIQKITTQFVKHLKSDDTNVDQSIDVITKVFGATLETVNGEN